MLEAVKERLKPGTPVSSGSEYLPTHIVLKYGEYKD
jgi:hypothetical protein